MKMQRIAGLATMAATTILLAACGGGSGNHDGNGAPSGSNSAPNSPSQTPAATDQLDAACLATPAVGQQVTGTLTVSPVIDIGKFQAKAIGKTEFDGGSFDTLELKLLDGDADDWGVGVNGTRVYVDPASPIFLAGVVEYGRSYQGKYNKYRRFTYTDSATGQTGTPNLVGMKPNETRSFTMAEANATSLATDPQPALKPITRGVNVSVQYIGREDVTAKGVTYKGACKLALHYERKDARSTFPMPVLEGTAWLAPSTGIVKLSGAPLVGVDTVTAETSGIVAAH